MNISDLNIKVDNPTQTQAVLRELGWLKPDERVLRCPYAGEGNMNLTLLVVTDRRRFVVKQAHPWVQKYPRIPAPPQRSDVERAFYQQIADIPQVAQHMPALLNTAPEHRLLMLEYLTDSQDFTDAYRGVRIEQEHLRALAAYLRALHALPPAGQDDVLTNRAMRRLNHEHLFQVPLRPDNGLDLERYEAGLTSSADALREDHAFLAAVSRAGKRYLEDGRSMLHGDYFPGSWLRTPRGPYVIDPEFSFPGDSAFDLAVAVAHLAMAAQPIASAEHFLASYGGAPPDPPWIARYAAVEVMRRIIGVAQLPIPPSDGLRSSLLERSRCAMREEDWRCLWA